MSLPLYLFQYKRLTLSTATLRLKKQFIFSKMAATITGRITTVNGNANVCAKKMLFALR